MALAQFRDNVIVASAGPRVASAMREVCGTLTDICRLRVLCPCMTNPDDSCTAACMQPESRALGICMHRAGGHGSCRAHPSAFEAQWSLKLGPALSSWAVQDVHLKDLYTSVVVNILPFISSWGGLLLSCAAGGCCVATLVPLRWRRYALSSPQGSDTRC